MNFQKTIDIINKYCLTCNKFKHSNKGVESEDSDFIQTFELELAKSIILDFGNNRAKKLGCILLSAVNE